MEIFFQKTTQMEIFKKMTNVSGVKRKYNIDINRIGNSNRDAIISDVQAELARRQAESGMARAPTARPTKP